MNLSTFAFTPSKYWAIPFAFAGLPWVILRFMPCFTPPQFLHRAQRFIAGGRSKEEEERERAEHEEQVKELEERIQGSTEENQKLKAQISQLTSDLQKSNNESTKLQRSLQRSQEETSSTQLSLRREQDEKTKALATCQRLTSEASALKRQVDTKDIEYAPRCSHPRTQRRISLPDQS
ncbi:hypothetical protein HYDPIDRAFT_110336 [Hydnomerulius pinastri MD-312]|nr:hypothetical protein HYDPIDRAFT_110336 [Hydnomerulius pinastri MD-312]